LELNGDRPGRINSWVELVQGVPMAECKVLKVSSPPRVRCDSVGYFEL